MYAFDITNKFRTIFIIDNRNYWALCRNDFDATRDLVLTYDFALVREINQLGGSSFYIDNLVNASEMDKNNYLIYNYFKNWHKRKDGTDIFSFKGIDFGFAFRQEFWNDYVFYLRLRLCLGFLKSASFDTIVVGSSIMSLTKVLDDIGVAYNSIKSEPAKEFPMYYFPIFRYMDEHVRNVSIKKQIIKGLNRATDWVIEQFENIGLLNTNRPRVYVQVYHPTKRILNQIKIDRQVSAVIENYSSGKHLSSYIEEKKIPIYGDKNKFSIISNQLMEIFRENIGHQLILSTGENITESINRIIAERISPRISYYLLVLDSVIRYFDKYPLSLLILMANLGIVSSIIDCYCRCRGIQRYLIINGMMSYRYLDEAKYATVINGYSQSIRENYFKGMENIVCLGDPRMDMYSKMTKNELDFNNPTITIGASGFNILSLNGFVAMEFEFLHDVLSALEIIIKNGKKINLIIKVRPNGYRFQYEQFVKEYFPSLTVQIEDTIPIIEILKRSDFYISIYSQTLFEASVIGIPVVYFKKDVENLFPPFDGKSELVTIETVKELVIILQEFLSGNINRFQPFLSKENMEKYIGSLDGKNLERNMELIYKMVQKQSVTTQHR